MQMCTYVLNMQVVKINSLFSTELFLQEIRLDRFRVRRSICFFRRRCSSSSPRSLFMNHERKFLVVTILRICDLFFSDWDFFFFLFWHIPCKSLWKFITRLRQHLFSCACHFAIRLFLLVIDKSELFWGHEFLWLSTFCWVHFTHETIERGYSATFCPPHG